MTRSTSHLSSSSIAVAIKAPLAFTLALSLLEAVGGAAFHPASPPMIPSITALARPAFIVGSGSQAPHRAAPCCPLRSSSSLSSSSGADVEVDTGSLKVLSDDHDAEAALLERSVAGWLDREWMPQDVHLAMASSASRTYVTRRNAGDDEIMSIMMAVAEDLDAEWREYDAEAFVNAWDVGNYVADYLMWRVNGGREGCSCSAVIYDPEEPQEGGA